MLNLWPECETILQKYFVYDKIFDLFYYDQNFEKLQAELTKLKQDCFPPNYRFVFLHYDTDYCIYPGIPGIMLTNLQQLLVELDIPNYFCLIVTNHFNIKQDLSYLQQVFTKDTHPIGSIICQLQQCHVKPFKELLPCEPTKLEHKFSCFNYTKKSHRDSLISLLNYKNLLGQGLVSYVK